MCSVIDFMFDGVIRGSHIKPFVQCGGVVQVSNFTPTKIWFELNLKKNCYFISEDAKASKENLLTVKK